MGYVPKVSYHFSFFVNIIFFFAMSTLSQSQFFARVFLIKFFQLIFCDLINLLQRNGITCIAD